MSYTVISNVDIIQKEQDTSVNIHETHHVVGFSTFLYVKYLIQISVLYKFFFNLCRSVVLFLENKIS